MLISLTGPDGPDKMYTGPHPKDGVAPPELVSWLDTCLR